MDMFRSEEMQLVRLIIPSEAAHDTIYSLGELGLLQFKDLNPHKSPFQRTYANQVKRCEEMARRLRFFTDQIEKSGHTLNENPSLERTFDLDELEVKLESLERELLEVNANSDKLRRSHSELVELQLVLEKAGAFFEDARSTARTDDYDSYGNRGNTPRDGIASPLLSMEAEAETKTTRLGFIAGTILEDKKLSFERILFRATRGNMFLKVSKIEGKIKEPSSGERKEKSVFVVFYSGEHAKTKITKICDAFDVNRYPFPEDTGRRMQMNTEVTSRLRELQTTIDASERHRDIVLSSINNNLADWKQLVIREKSVYHTFNLLSIDVTRQCLIAEAWCPTFALDRTQDVLQRAAMQSNAQVGTIIQPISTKESPPTYFKTNKLTAVFQGIVDAYGVAQYREANPAVFTIVTFPFLFAVMFGDVGHGILLSLAAGFMILREKAMMRSKLNEMVAMCFGGRYLLFGMGIMSIYIGFIYNEFFSIPMSIFGRTSWDLEKPDTVVDQFVKGKPYPVGFDPIWHGHSGELPFTNSIKMKMSIIIGVCHMTVGIVMSLMNHLYRKDRLSIYAEFVPQMLLLYSMFGYLSLLIVLKWTLGTVAQPITADLYHILIYMFLSPGNIDCPTPDGPPQCPENKIFAGQGFIQVMLVLIIMVSVPWMLFPKPFILKWRHEKKQKVGGAQYGMLSDDENFGNDNDDDSVDDHGGGGHGHGEFVFGEVMVHQMIHTIEFVLGVVSNTASYLRLWALSLAHSQLSAVFYDRILLFTISTGNVGLMMIGIFAFFCTTMGVLMIMETLSAFLHALRLHWVEFQNKFYAGDGYAFVPLSFAAIAASGEL